MKHHHSSCSPGQTWSIWNSSSGTYAQSTPNFHVCVHAQHSLLHISHPRRTNRSGPSGNGATSLTRLRRLRHWTSWIQAPSDWAQSSRFLRHPQPPVSWCSRSPSVQLLRPRAAERALSSGSTWGKKSNFTLSLGLRCLTKPNLELAKKALPSRLLTKGSNSEGMSKNNDCIQCIQASNPVHKKKRNLRNLSRFGVAIGANVQRCWVKVLTVMLPHDHSLANFYCTDASLGKF